MTAIAEKRQTRNRRRRARDRLVEGDHQSSERLVARVDLSNHLLLIDDELRETALALGGIERYLVRTLTVLEKDDLSVRDLAAMAEDIEVEDRVAELEEMLTSLKRRLRFFADSLARSPRGAGPQQKPR